MQWQHSHRGLNGGHGERCLIRMQRGLHEGLISVRWGSVMRRLSRLDSNSSVLETAPCRSSELCSGEDTAEDALTGLMGSLN
jgi:hypothetical protein